jgi:oxaloacetate decarboxylase alpha subunit
MALEDMEPIYKNFDNVGYHSLEVWGGAHLRVAIRFLKRGSLERSGKYVPS